MKTITHPKTGKLIKFGRTPPKPELLAKVPKFKNYFKSKCAVCGGSLLPIPPQTLDYSLDAVACLSLVMMNDQLGNCTCAGCGHQLGLWTGNAGNLITMSDAQVLAMYEAVGHYVPGDPSTDCGANELDVLNYLMQTGFPDGTKLSGYLAIDGSNQEEVMLAMYLAESLYFGVCLPDSWINPFPSGNGFVWDFDSPNPDNGHCFIGTGYQLVDVIGYNALGVNIDTWGMLGTITWEAVAGLTADGSNGQLFALFSPDSINTATGLAPTGLNWDQLTADFKVLGGRGGLVG